MSQSGHYEDRLTIDTPEGVSMTLPLAGVGSRFVAAGVDFTIQLILLGAAAIVFLEFSSAGAASGGVFALASFLIFVAYDVAFEVLSGGRTPGKRLNGLRVVRTGGQPVGFVASSVRNLLRFVDILPFFYLVGIVTVLVTRKNQRLGDLAAGTVVARAPRRPRGSASFAAPAASGAVPSSVSGWDVSGITAEELATVRSFLERRHDLAHGARVELARTMAAGLRPRVGGLPAGGELSDELFLERLAQAKSARI